MADLTPKREKAIAALLSEPSTTAAAAKVGIGETTIYRWLNDAAFAEAYREARRAAVHQAISRLQQVSSNAVQVLVSVMEDPQTPATARISAAKAVLEFAIKAVEFEDIQVRLAALEKLYENRETAA